MYPLIFLLAGVNAAGIGEAWQVTPHAKSIYADHPFRPRLDSSAFEVRTVSGVGRLSSHEETINIQKQRPELTIPSSAELNALPDAEEILRESENLKHLRKSLDDSSYRNDEVEDEAEDDTIPIRKMLETKLMMRILKSDKEDGDDDEQDRSERRGFVERVRRQAENETNMEKISTSKSVRETRLLNTPEMWSSSVQPISVEFRQRIPLDQVIQQQQEEEEAALANGYRRYQAPRADFVTSSYRRNYAEGRESRDMPLTRDYQDDYEAPWFRNAIRDRDYEYSPYRRGYGYQYPNRYRTGRDYYMRPSDSYYYDRYDRYREDDLDVYGRNRPAPRPRRIIYYATLPEIVRKPVDLRNYPRSPYDANTIKSVTRDGAYKRVPGNVDPGRYRYRHLYDAYDPYTTKRSSNYDRVYEYPESENPRRVKVSTKETLRNDGHGGASNERKVSNLVAIRNDDGKLPWPVQIGTEVSIKDDERIPGRKIFGENGGYERFQSAQLQKAPDATGSSELQSGD